MDTTPDKQEKLMKHKSIRHWWKILHTKIQWKSVIGIKDTRRGQEYTGF